MKQTLLSLSNLTKQFDGKTVLDSLDLEIFDGEFITLLGPSGCGKTTLLRMMVVLSTRMRVHHPWRAGSDPYAAGAPSAEYGVPELRAVPPYVGVRQMAYGLKMEKRPKEEIRQRVASPAMVQLEDFARRKPHQPGGQQQRVAIARAVVKRPKMLLWTNSCLFWTSLRAPCRWSCGCSGVGITFVFVTHDQEEAIRCLTGWWR